MKQKCTIVLICIIAAFSTIAQVNVQDSLALVVLYNNTNGPGWLNHKHWLSEKPLSEWYGIYVENNRVAGIYLWRNQLNGTIPADFWNLTNLQYLYLHENQLSGSIAAELGNFAGLQHLYLSDNQLSGSIPAELGKLTNLQDLYLNNNQFSGNIPAAFSNLTNLQYLYLNANQFSGNVPAEFGNLTNLQDLYLNNNQLSGNIPAELGNLTQLENLHLNVNQLSGNIPAQLENLTNLPALYLNNNQLSGSIPAELGNLTNLLSLYLDSNQLSGSIPAELGNLVKLSSLYLNDNKLSGNIPPELTSLTNLYNLILNNNELTGSIPPALSNLSLSILDLSYNNLSGTIPAEFGNFNSLYRLNLSHNQLSGSIPDELENDLNIHQLLLNDNNLTGSIPYDLDNLYELEEIDLSSNHLSGAIPISLVGNIDIGLQTYNVQNNQFTFDGMAPYAYYSNSHNYSFTFRYVPQAIIPLHTNGDTLSVYANETPYNCTYKWYKNGTLYKTLFEDSTLKITEAGEYFVKVTNSDVKYLTLISDTFNIDVLPVSLLSLTAQKQKDGSLLQWQTATEINNSYFNIERSSNSVNFTAIGKVDALNGPDKNNYSFIDNTPLYGINYYRLKQVDNDETYIYSKVVSTDFTGYSSMFSVSPNPATSEIKIILPKINSASQINMFDVSGKKVISLHTTPNINSTQINISSLAAGIYTIVITQNNKQQSFKLIKK